MRVVQAPEYDCLNCKGTGKVNKGWFFEGDSCPACTNGKVHHTQKICKRCRGQARVSSGFLNLRSAVCPNCRGGRYVTHKQIQCVTCEGKGGLNGIFGSSSCPSCEGKGYLHDEQRTCLLCKKSGVVQNGWFSSKPCPACKGSGMSVGEQFACRSCSMTGLRSGLMCPLCNGKCLLPYDQIKCSQCQGLGMKRSWFSTVECEACHRCGFVPLKTHVIPIVTHVERETSDSSEEEASLSEDEEEALAALEHLHEKMARGEWYVGVGKKVGVGLLIAATTALFLWFNFSTSSSSPN